MRNINNATVNIKLMRDNHGYKPYFFNLTFDGCNYMKNQKNPFINLFYKPLKETSSFNHSCPYGEEIIVDKLWTGNLEVDFLKYLPISNGNYAIFFTIYVYNVELFYVHIYLQLMD
ncbi:uncharacterized protein LOC133845467 isoform X3 [Drosophila sulfurigaster albostrigata]|uniref:uncharacterized protein LOC133845467 isoform X3 n=1 Tax=Drosophila sulfurigaster albostrigata TaxID=89887 RepID=UPI002D21E9BF|nr:uncharacterized protein LOC133845467 isoform X3 [Drosophila sulfurigaster albostrigata]